MRARHARCVGLLPRERPMTRLHHLHRSHRSRRTRHCAVTLLMATGLATSAGCLDRPVADRAPRLGTTFTSDVTSKVIDKIDILFDIDNSASMGDKQDYLKAAIPDLVNRLINPNCINPMTNASDGPSNAGVCPVTTDQAEFTPVHDLHLGIISSSLGSRGGDACLPGAMAQPPFQN